MFEKYKKYTGLLGVQKGVRPIFLCYYFNK